LILIVIIIIVIITIVIIHFYYLKHFLFCMYFDLKLDKIILFLFVN